MDTIYDEYNAGYDGRGAWHGPRGSVLKVGPHEFQWTHDVITWVTDSDPKVALFTSAGPTGTVDTWEIAVQRAEHGEQEPDLDDEMIAFLSEHADIYPIPG